MTAGDALGVEVLPGVELSSIGKDAEIHILGYCVNPEAFELLEALDTFRQARYRRAEKIVRRLNQAGVRLEITEVVEVSGTTAIGRPHIAQALVRNGTVSSFNDAFQKFLKRGGPAFVQKEMLSPREAIEVIHRAGGVAVVAHPVYGPNTGELRRMTEHGLDGIEVKHPLMSPEDTTRFTKIANEYKLVTTGGSDYHGEGRSKCALGGMEVTYSCVRSLLERKAARHQTDGACPTAKP
jgi:hypothetical protein